MRKLALDDDILLEIEKPARYIGGEVNAVMKNVEDIDVALRCVSRMSMRSVCLIWGFRFFMICSTAERMCGVREFTLHGMIWIK
mgnify:CR=1 FL=1